MEHVTLTLDGRHLRLGDDERLHLGDSGLDLSAVFERLPLGHGRVALRSADGRFLSVRPDPGLSYAVYPDTELTPAAAFEEILWPTGQVSLKSCHLTYLAADEDGRVTANRTRAGLRERFFLVTVAVPAVPGRVPGQVPGQAPGQVPGQRLPLRTPARTV